MILNLFDQNTQKKLYLGWCNVFRCWLHSGGGKWFVHESLLGKAEPEFGGFAILGAEYFLHEAVAHLLAGLCEVLPKKVSLLLAGGPPVDWIQWEAGLAWNVELGDGQRVHLVGGLVLVRALLQLLEALGTVTIRFKNEIEEIKYWIKLNYM